MFTVDEATAEAIRRACQDGGELAGVVELRRHYPLRADNASARLCVRAIATAPTQRYHHLQFIAEHGRAAWQKACGYTKRARVEAAIGRFKQVIGDGLRSRTDQRKATEVDVAVHALNRMLEFGRSISVRIA